ncbi:DUF3967 domain-containing protein (plasmid) [Lysinibacillus capsici]|uniref:DUF3967 domain-containing protein n=1 Tax=Lysinibacillus capsici TaxID=2115968 RepID=UPI0021D97684|nr:DUF3967 domain-containing protein [Lysinibacillus capsici]UYB49936.1 DUF3967 domain-containing protein [Lysinibacillus capsici]
MSDTSNINFISDISDTTIGGELIYDTVTVSKMLGVQESTLRKYCALMQKHHYEFNKNSVGHRIFYPRDVEIIKEIVTLKNLGSLTLNEAVKAILDSDIDDITDTATRGNPDYSKLLEEFEAFKKSQMQFNQKLLERLEKQQSYIENSIDERDKKLMLAIKESMETRRQLVAEEEKKKSWWKFWR